MADFHFIRPLWLLLLLAIPALFAMRHRLRNGSSGWARYIPAPLLQPLMHSRDESTSGLARSPLIPLYLALACLSIALAGPSWRQAPTPLKQPQDSLVILLDLSLSMLATDVEPDRLTQAKRKVRDILDQRQGGLTALAVYSGDAHTVTPLTGDTRTIEAMLSVLEPTIMPAQGNRADLAVSQAINLLQQGAPGQGRMVLITDAIPERQRSSIQQQLANTSYPLSTLVVGTREGGPIPLAKRGFIRDQGKIVISRARPDRLADLARENGGKSHELTLDDRDIQALALQPSDADDWQAAKDDLTTNRWQDDGYWILWAVLPLLLAGWRRGAFATIAVLLIPLTGTPQTAQAVEWDSLWQREDQRGPKLIQQDPGKAAEILEQPGWRGSALYRDGQYGEAAKVYADQPGAIGHYNRGNALAHAGKLEDAIEAYQQALNEDPTLEDALANQKLVQELLDQQQESQNQSGDDQNQPDNGQNSEQPSPAENPGDESQESSGQESQNESRSQSSGDQQESSQQDQASQDNPGDPSAESGDQQATPSQGQTEPAPTDNQAGQAQSPAEISEQPLSQGQEQWLRRIPDNPGGLLQRKFLQQHQQRQTTPDEGDTPW